MTEPRALAAVLDEAARAARAVPQLTASNPLTLVQAYAVQAAGITLRVDRGDPMVGVKLGFTSKAKAQQMGVDDVIIGVITESMCVDDGGTVDAGRLIHPRIEPEVAFRLVVDVDPDDPSQDPLTAVGDVALAMEIIDSRYEDFRFTLEDVVADNTSAAGFVVGQWQPLVEMRRSVELTNLGVVLEVDGTIVEAGSTAAILGDPLRALAVVKRMARQYGLRLPAGSVILAGAATAAVPLPRSGSAVTASASGLGRVSVNVGGRDER